MVDHAQIRVHGLEVPRASLKAPRLVMNGATWRPPAIGAWLMGALMAVDLASFWLAVVVLPGLMPGIASGLWIMLAAFVISTASLWMVAVISQRRQDARRAALSAGAALHLSLRPGLVWPGGEPAQGQIEVRASGPVGALRAGPGPARGEGVELVVRDLSIEATLALYDFLRTPGGARPPGDPPASA